MIWIAYLQKIRLGIDFAAIDVTRDDFRTGKQPADTSGAEIGFHIRLFSGRVQRRFVVGMRLCLIGQTSRNKGDAATAPKKR